MNKNLIKGIVISILTSLLASLSAAGTKYLSSYLKLQVIICAQYGIGLLISGAILMRGGMRGFFTNRPLLHLLRGLSGLGAFYAFYYTLNCVHMMVATLLRNAAPLCVPIIVWCWLGITIPRRRWLPVIVGFIGVIFILQPSPQTFCLYHLIGLCSAILLGISMVSTRLLVYTETNITVVFYYYAIAFIGSLPGAVIAWHPAPFDVWLTMLVVAILLYISMCLYTITFRYAKPSVISPVSFFGVAFAGFWGWLFWGQVPVAETYLGMFLVMVGAVIIIFQGEFDI